MGANDLRNLRKSLSALEQNIAAAGTIHRRLRRGIKVAWHRLDRWADALNMQARQQPEPSSDGWPHERHEFGRAVLHARERSRLSRERLATIVGCCDTTIANIERGHTRCRDDIRRAIIQAFAKIETQR